MLLSTAHEIQPLPGMYTVPAECFKGLDPELLARLPQQLTPPPCTFFQNTRSFSTTPPSLDRPTSVKSRENASIRRTIESTLPTTINSGTPYLPETRIKETESKSKKWRDFFKNVNYVITYNGTKAKSTKKVNNATRIAAIALPIIQTLIPQVQIATSIYKTLYSVAQLTGFAPKDPTIKKAKKLNPIESPLTRSALAVGVVVAGFFAWKVGIIGFAAVKIGLDVLDLRNNIHENGFTKEAVLIMIKAAGSIAYLALAIFDSNLVLIFTITTKLASSFFTAYCEASQGRLPEALASIALGLVSNISNIESVVTSIETNTFTDEDTVDIGIQSVSAVSDMRTDDKEMRQQIKNRQAIIAKQKEEEVALEEEDASYYRRRDEDRRRDIAIHHQ